MTFRWQKWVKYSFFLNLSPPQKALNFHPYTRQNSFDILENRDTVFFVKGALFWGKGGPPVLEEPARHCPRQGRGFVGSPVCPTPPAISSACGWVPGGQLTDCWHQMIVEVSVFYVPVIILCVNRSFDHGINLVCLLTVGQSIVVWVKCLLQTCCKGTMPKNGHNILPGRTNLTLCFYFPCGST